MPRRGRGDRLPCGQPRAVEEPSTWAGASGPRANRAGYGSGRVPVVATSVPRRSGSALRPADRLCPVPCAPAPPSALRAGSVLCPAERRTPGPAGQRGPGPAAIASSGAQPAHIPTYSSACWLSATGCPGSVEGKHKPDPTHAWSSQAARAGPAPHLRRTHPHPQEIGSSSTWVTSSATFDRSERWSVMCPNSSFSFSASTTEAIPS